MGAGKLNECKPVYGLLGQARAEDATLDLKAKKWCVTPPTSLPWIKPLRALLFGCQPLTSSDREEVFKLRK